MVRYYAKTSLNTQPNEEDVEEDKTGVTLAKQWGTRAQLNREASTHTKSNSALQTKPSVHVHVSPAGQDAEQPFSSPWPCSLQKALQPPQSQGGEGGGVGGLGGVGA